MCVPVGVALAGSIASAALGAMGDVVNYNASVEDFNSAEDQWQGNYKSSLAAGRDENDQLLSKAFQEQQATSGKMSRYTQEEAIKKAMGEVSAASSGVSGNSVDGLIRDIGRGAAENRYAAKVNGDNTALQITQELKGARVRTQNRINSVTRPKAPNASGAFLSILGRAAGVAADM